MANPVTEKKTRKPRAPRVSTPKERALRALRKVETIEAKATAIVAGLDEETAAMYSKLRSALG